MTCTRCPSDVATHGCRHCGEIGRSTELTGADTWRTTYRWRMPTIVLAGRITGGWSRHENVGRFERPCTIRAARPRNET